MIRKEGESTKMVIRRGGFEGFLSCLRCRSKRDLGAFTTHRPSELSGRSIRFHQPFRSSRQQTTRE